MLSIFPTFVYWFFPDAEHSPHFCLLVPPWCWAPLPMFVYWFLPDAEHSPHFCLLVPPWCWALLPHVCLLVPPWCWAPLPTFVYWFLPDAEHPSPHLSIGSSLMPIILPTFVYWFLPDANHPPHFCLLVPPWCWAPSPLLSTGFCLKMKFVL